MTNARFAEVLRRLERLGDPERNLSTGDTLLCEIMIANTISNLAVAEAIDELTEEVHKDSIRPVTIKGHWNIYPLESDTQLNYKQNRITNQMVLAQSLLIVVLVAEIIALVVIGAI